MTTTSEAAKHASRTKHYLVKALEVGDEPDIDESAAIQEQQERQDLFNKAGAIEPPFPPHSLANLLEVSTSLRPNVDAYAVNIDGFGHRFEPAIDLEQEDADDAVIDAILMHQIHSGGGKDSIEEPTPEEVAERKKELRLLARIERSTLKVFFSFCADKGSFPALRKKTRVDLEVLANAYWEVLRNKGGKLARFVHVPGVTVRLRALDPESVLVEERVPISEVEFTTIKVRKQFRTFVQITDDGRTVFFKQFGDPRVVSRKTGAVFVDKAALLEAEEHDVAATEMIHHKIDSMDSPYGKPRWIGSMLSVLGSRASEEVNYFYFENKSVPPLAILVSGGRLSKSSVPRIEDYIENNLKGRRNFHKILIIEATSPSGRSDSGATNQRPVIELKPLTDAQQQDALFQNYDERNMDKIGGSFRLPRLLRGETKDFNRATAFAALRFAEDQVFQPEREDFDDWINRVILPELGITFWRFMSNAPITRDPETMGKLTVSFVEKGILTPAEGRLLAGDVFNREFDVIKEEWTKQPIQFTLAGIQQGKPPTDTEKALTTGDMAAGLLGPSQVEPLSIPSIESTAENTARNLLRIRSAMMEAVAGMETVDLAKARADDDTIVIEVDRDEMQSWMDDSET